MSFLTQWYLNQVWRVSWFLKGESIVCRIQQRMPSVKKILSIVSRHTCASDDKQQCFKLCNFLIGVWCDARTKTYCGAQNWRQFAESKTQTIGNDSVKDRLIAPDQNTKLDLGLLMARLKRGFLNNIRLFRRNQEASICVGGRLLLSRQVLDLTNRHVPNILTC